MFKSIESYTGIDPCPGVDIQDIRVYSRRAYALMIRNRTKPLLKEGFLNVAGAIEMLGGLEYHHDNIVRLSNILASAAIDDIARYYEETKLYHEAVAYVNRMGQFYYFARSEFVKQSVEGGLAQIPTIERYIVFRMKHTAHRSIDYPRNEPDHVKLSQAMSLTRAWGMIMSLKPGAREVIWSGQMKADSPVAREMHRQQWETRQITFQLFHGDSDRHLNFTIEREHESICAEAYAVLRTVILWDAADKPATW